MKKILYIVYAVFFCFTFGYGYVAFTTFDGGVEHSYKKGMDYKRKLLRKRELGLKFDGQPQSVVVGREFDLSLLISADDEKITKGAMVFMQVSRLAESTSLDEARTTERSQGLYSTKMIIPGVGHWLVTARIHLSGEKEEFIHEFRIFAEGKLNES